MDKFGRFTIGLFLLALSSLWCTFVVMIVWNWFAPVLLGLKQFTLVQTYAFTILVGLIKGTNLTNDKADKARAEGNYLEYVIEIVLGSSIAYGFVLLMAYILRNFV